MAIWRAICSMARGESEGASVHQVPMAVWPGGRKGKARMATSGTLWMLLCTAVSVGGAVAMLME